MKLRGALTGVAVAAADIALMLFVSDKTAAMIIVAVFTVAMCIFLQYSISSEFKNVKKSLEETLKKLDEAEEENLKLENIRTGFVANVTHELKTPLTSISGFIETLQAGAADDPEIRCKFLDIIAIETDRLKRLIEDIFVLSDIESTEEIAQDPIDVKRAIESTSEFLQPMADERNLTLITDVEDGVYVKGELDRFRQLLFNLVDNAIKYSHEGGRIWISCRKEEDKTILTVKDEGIGINPGDIPRLFERFYRADQSRSRKVSGTGLGLSIVKHIAALFDARIEVKSKPGAGSLFKVIF